MLQTSNKPVYREDIKGNVAGIKADCVDMFRGEIQGSDNFTFTMEDCEATLKEYSQYLTPAELKGCFNKAVQQ